jgi:hypothetical protein
VVVVNNLRVSLAFVAAIVAFGLAPGLALADPGNGQGGGITHNPNVPPGQSDQDLTAPQPSPDTDFSGNGANVEGPYDSTRDGSPSQNGDGGGEAVGLPCAGCVGEADNKNPPGQLPGGSDVNAGYECDTNHGVGRGNPAHTACTAENPPTTPPRETPLVQPPANLVQPVPAAEAAPVVQAAAADELAFTGFSIAGPALAGLVLVGAGGTLFLAGDRPKKP